MIQIANPAYDVVFKYLMADYKSAKTLLSALLGEHIEILELLPQERSVSLRNKTDGIQPVLLSAVRFNYCATLSIAGEKKKVLIELQKGNYNLDVARFRQYLDINYDSKTRLDGVKEVLPIIAVYLFGFNMDGVEPAITCFHPSGTDLIENIPFSHGKNEIIDSLTHTSYFVQLSKLPTKSKNRVGKVLSVFSQQRIHEVDKKKLFLPEDLMLDENIKILVDRLHHALLDEETQRQLIEEDEYEQTIEHSIKSASEKSRQEGKLEGWLEGKLARSQARNSKKNEIGGINCWANS